MNKLTTYQSQPAPVTPVRVAVEHKTKTPWVVLSVCATGMSFFAFLVVSFSYWYGNTKDLAITNCNKGISSACESIAKYDSFLPYINTPEGDRLVQEHRARMRDSR